MSAKRDSPSYVIRSVLAGVALGYAFRLSHGDRGPADWTVITLIGLALLWNLHRAGQRLRQAGGPRALWALQRTLLFWIIGLLNTLPEVGADPTTWRLPVGLALLLLAVVETLRLIQRERTAAHAPAPPPR